MKKKDKRVLEYKKKLKEEEEKKAKEEIKRKQEKAEERAKYKEKLQQEALFNLEELNLDDFLDLPPEEVKQEKQKVDECYLCLESLELRGGRMIINPGCGHLLHMKCYLEYIKYFKEQCTLCKKDFGSWND